MKSATRIPLSTGATAFRGIFIGAIAGGVIGFSASYFTSAHRPDAMIRLMIGTFAFFAAVYTAVMIAGIISSRATDLEVGEQRFVVLGGPHAGPISWSTIDPSAVVVKGKNLLVSGATLAYSEAEDERVSLRSVASMIIAHVAPSPPPDTPPEVEIVKCPSCGAPARPADAETTPCTKCSAAIAMPATLRARVRAATELDAETKHVARVSSKLASFPSATATNAWIVASSFSFIASVALASFAFARGWPAYFLYAVAASLPLLTFARLAIADRTGAVALASGCAARAPAAPGEPHTCRSCGAPLAEPPNVVLVRCAYCRSDNVLGFDLRSDAAEARWRAGSFELALAHRRRGELWRAVAVVASVVLVVAGWRIRFAKAAERPDASACVGGDDQACVDFCRKAVPYDCTMMADGLRTSRHYERLVHIWTVQCEQDGNVLACDDAADSVAAGKHVRKDMAEALRLAGVACSHDSGRACAIVGASKIATDERAARDDFARACKLNYVHACGCKTEPDPITCDPWLVPMDPFEFDQH